MRRRPLTWALAGLAIVVIVAVGLPVFSVLQPDYYRRYPALGPRMDHWTTSTHSRIACGACHIEPGVKGFVSFSARAIPAFYSQLMSGPDTTNLLQSPSRAACQKCHTTYRAVAPSGDLLIPHKAHVEVLKMECTACHKDLVHSLNKDGFNRPTMQTCLTCHDGDKATADCVKCHTRKETPATHKQANWLRVHGTAAASQDCAQCHDWTPGYCAECHEKRPASHIGNWKKAHAAPAKERGDGCLVCHGGEEFCKTCH